MKILNLYAGIGGNRKLWTPNGNEHEITAVEINPEIAKIYQDFFPNDKIIIADAHEYLLNNFEKYDFIWSSPPCPTHSRIRNIAGVGRGQNEPVYPDMKLYEEIIFLKNIYMSSGTNFKGLYCVENVISYYYPLIEPLKLHNHYFWTNFFISPLENIKRYIGKGKIKQWQGNLKFDISKYKLNNRKDQVLRNCVIPELGLHILNCAMGIYDYRKNKEQLKLNIF